MLTQTTETALRVLIFLNRNGRDQPVSVRRLREVVGGSPTYLAKTIGDLVKAGVLQSFRGANGGVKLAADPDQLTLLTIVETCQGVLPQSYCQLLSAEFQTCSFHLAMLEVRSSLVEVLSRWTLKDLSETVSASDKCKMRFPSLSDSGPPPKGAK